MTADDRVVVVDAWDRRRWIVWVMFAASAVIAAIAMSFTLIVSIQRADRADAQVDQAEERNREALEAVACRAMYSAAIDMAEHEAENADNLFTILIANESLSQQPVTAATYDRFSAAIAELQAADRAARKAIEERAAYLEAGSPLPCPIS